MYTCRVQLSSERKVIACDHLNKNIKLKTSMALTTRQLMKGRKAAVIVVTIFFLVICLPLVCADLIYSQNGTEKRSDADNAKNFLSILSDIKKFITERTLVIALAAMFLCVFIWYANSYLIPQLSSSSMKAQQLMLQV